MSITIDNSKVFLNGVYGDASVNIKAKTSLKEGTVLGVDTTEDSDTAGKVIPFDSTKCELPSYILAQDIVNESDEDIEISSARVFECGEVNKNKLIFINEADTLTQKIVADLKAGGILAVEVQELTKTDVVL